MLVGGLNQPRARLLEPGLDPITRLLQGERALVEPRVGADADEGFQDRPAEADGIGPAEPIIPPTAFARLSCGPLFRRRRFPSQVK